MTEFYTFLHSLPPEWIWLAQLFAVYGLQLLLLRLFGADGLKMFIILAVIGAGIMLMKPVQFSVMPSPLALGTILFVATYLATDMLSEYYGAATARKAVWMGFAGNASFLLIEQFTLAYRPLTAAEAGAEWSWALASHPAMEVLFAPAPALMLAGFTAYLVSQFLDIWLYERIRKTTNNKGLWLRNNGSTIVSTLVDNTVFSVMAFMILAAQPVPMKELVVTYIFGAALMRWGIALFDTPFLYLARHALPPADRPKDLKPLFGFIRRPRTASDSV